MSSSVRHIRELIGENEVEKAIAMLLELFDGEERWHDLYDLTVLQKSHWSDYNRKDRMGLARKEDFSQLMASLIEILRDYEKRLRQEPPAPTPPPRQPPPPPRQPAPPPQAPTQPRQVARCYMTGDPTAYFVLDNDQVVGLNEHNGQTWAVAARTPSMVAEWAWFIQFPNGFYYSVDHQGRIWGLNGYGFPMQLGYVQYL